LTSDQLDIKNVFLHGILDEKVYGEKPPGFIAQGESEKVCKLKKILIWVETVTKSLI